MPSTPKAADEPADQMADRALWRRSRSLEVSDEETRRLIDLAAFAEDTLDPDERERIAALVGADPAAADDIEAARALKGTPEKNSPAIERIIVRACALRSDGAAGGGAVIRFPGLRRRVLFQGLARWASLAAAVAVAAWLGFAMGSDASLALNKPAVSAEEGTAIELFDPATGFLHDVIPGTQT